VLPPKGLDVAKLDGIQKKLHEICHKLQPTYFPVVEPYEIDGKHILVVWVPGGEHRPYKAPKSLVKNAEMLYYIRRLSSTAKVNTQEEQQLRQLAAKIPFDDRINHHASIDNLSLAEIRIFLQDVKSDLFKSSQGMDFEELVRAIQIARGAVEYLRPVNVGLLFFCETPEKFFPYTQIEVTIYHDDIGDKFTEKVFKGAIHQQLRQALSHIKTLVIEEYVQKVDGQAEAIRFYNYPFQAVEEALANAVYHKSYEEREPIKVNVFADKMEIISHGGAMPPIVQDDFKKDRITTMKYLNRRIGDFLKELHLTEGKGTGIPKIKRAMRNNGSNEPIFETDDARTYFVVTLRIKPMNVAVTPETIIIPADNINKPPDNRRIPPDTTLQEKKVLEYIIEHKTITSKVVELLLGIKERRTRELLKQMTDKELILKQGQARSTHYTLKHEEK
jgi:ATP-dependent DNA helicase RecG